MSFFVSILPIVADCFLGSITGFTLTTLADCDFHSPEGRSFCASFLTCLSHTCLSFFIGDFSIG
jgi:hypothetical protein